jgi:hypothetical protein
MLAVLGGDYRSRMLEQCAARVDFLPGIWLSKTGISLMDRGQNSVNGRRTWLLDDAEDA